MKREFTGWHMAAIMVGFFAVVIAVNITMAMQASRTFGGLVVENAYVASQHYNRWLDEASREKALGWQADVKRRYDGRLAVRLEGVPVEQARLSGLAWHPLGREVDRTMTFSPDANGVMVSHEVLPAGRWFLRLVVRAEGRTWRTESSLQ